MTLEQSLIEAVRSLPPEKQQELLEHANQRRRANPKKPRKSGRGLWADLNISISVNEIDEVRREMWFSVPRDDV